jgi:hypothetical protein
MRYDPERKVSGIMSVNIWCTAESAATPEDIEKRLVELISGTFYTDSDNSTVCAVWNRSDAFDFEGRTADGSNTAPEVFGITVLFDLTEFPEQITTDPDPVQGLNLWTKKHFPAMTVIAHDNMPPVWKPANENPAVYWRFEGISADAKLSSYAVNWYSGQFAAHIIAQNVTERNRWTKAVIEAVQLRGEIVLVSGSPMLAKQIAVRHNADPLREGQLLLTGQYGVLAQRRREYAQIPLNSANFSDKNTDMEVSAHGK